MLHALDMKKRTCSALSDRFYSVRCNQAGSYGKLSNLVKTLLRDFFLAKNESLLPFFRASSMAFHIINSPFLLKTGIESNGSNIEGQIVPKFFSSSGKYALKQKQKSNAN